MPGSTTVGCVCVCACTPVSGRVLKYCFLRFVIKQKDFLNKRHVIFVIAGYISKKRGEIIKKKGHCKGREQLKKERANLKEKE